MYRRPLYLEMAKCFHDVKRKKTPQKVCKRYTSLTPIQLSIYSTVSGYTQTHTYYYQPYASVYNTCLEIIY